jgi:hypothetical protein
MTWFAAITTGFGLGLASFGALWLSVRQLVRQRRRMLVSAGGVVRLLLLGLALYALDREGPDKLLAGLAGLWLARWSLTRGLGGTRHGG